jgi:putative tricarboxylic transport membrane protein
MKVKTILAAAVVAAMPFAAQAWEPTKNVEFIIPAGTGGGADQMARAIQGIVAKHNLMKQSILPINKAGGAGAEGFLDVKGAAGDPHKIIITLSNLFTTPLATGVPFNWRDLTSSSPTSPSRVAAPWRRSWSAGTSIRPSTTRSRRWRNGARATCGRCACSS